MQSFLSSVFAAFSPRANAAVLHSLDNLYLQTILHRTHGIPGLASITRKDALALSIQRMERGSYSSQFTFLPKTYVLPWQQAKFLSTVSDGKWIVKPSNSSCGDGISIHSDSQLAVDAASSIFQSSADCGTSIISRYVPSPHLIHGHKFDLRLYAVLIPDSDHGGIKSFLYTDGLVRFCTDKYGGSMLTSQITNYTINSTVGSDNFVEDDEEGGVRGKDDEDVKNSAKLDYHKWSLAALLPHLPPSFNILEDAALIVAKVAASAQIKKTGEKEGKRYELVGVDLLVDEKGCAWLIEVQNRPSLQPSSGLDTRIKGKLVKDIKSLVGEEEGGGVGNWVECVWGDAVEAGREAREDTVDREMFGKLMMEDDVIQYEVEMGKEANGGYVC